MVQAFFFFLCVCVCVFLISVDALIAGVLSAQSQDALLLFMMAISLQLIASVVWRRPNTSKQRMLKIQPYLWPRCSFCSTSSFDVRGLEISSGSAVFLWMSS